MVLIRHWARKPDKAIANHIVMVDSFDPATGRLVTIEGNVHEGIRPDAEGDATRTADGDLANAAGGEGRLRRPRPRHGRPDDD